MRRPYSSDRSRMPASTLGSSFRNGAVHAVVVRRDAADCGKRRLAPCPEGQPLLLRGRSTAHRRAILRRDLFDPSDQMIDLDARPVEFDDQQRLAVERIPRVDKILRRVDRRPVHHLHAARNDAGADDVGDALSALLAGWKSDQQCARRLGFLRMRTVTSVTTPSSPSEPVMTPSRS